jgi:hypothetical protein
MVLQAIKFAFTVLGIVLAATFLMALVGYLIDKEEDHEERARQR